MFNVEVGNGHNISLLVSFLFITYFYHTKILNFVFNLLKLNGSMEVSIMRLLKNFEFIFLYLC
jgi:hypothetical protein